ncbi:hypothetical protein NP493_1151g00135 [Ridgeia piscesae]|uniref:Uncharacterized protein n=1 Tax=Ridgeia piscesae TaxID=27915 RepID=A0AAD9KFS9_RIDPI|nr:hypothetical protein NP493_1151g00135 [Ridgeia piscesae]
MKSCCLIAFLVAVFIGTALSKDDDEAKTWTRCHIYCWWDKWHCVRMCLTPVVPDTTQRITFGGCFLKCLKTEKSCVKHCKD